MNHARPNQRYKLIPLDTPDRYELKIFHRTLDGTDWVLTDIIEASLQMLVNEYILHDTGLRAYRDRRRK